MKKFISIFALAALSFLLGIYYQSQQDNLSLSVLNNQLETTDEQLLQELPKDQNSQNAVEITHDLTGNSNQLNIEPFQTSLSHLTALHNTLEQQINAMNKDELIALIAGFIPNSDNQIVKNMAMRAIFTLAEKSVDDAVYFLRQIEPESNYRMRKLIGKWTSVATLDELMSLESMGFFENIEDKQLKVDIKVNAFHQIIKLSESEGLNYLSQLIESETLNHRHILELAKQNVPDHYPSILEALDKSKNYVHTQTLMGQWINTSNEQAIAYMKSLPKNKKRKELLTGAFWSWSRHEPIESGNWYISNFEGDEKSQAISKVVISLSYDNPQLAIDWIDSLENVDHQPLYYNSMRFVSANNVDMVINNLSLLKDTAQRLEVSRNTYEYFTRSNQTIEAMDFANSSEFTIKQLENN